MCFFLIYLLLKLWLLLDGHLHNLHLTRQTKIDLKYIIHPYISPSSNDYLKCKILKKTWDGTLRTVWNLVSRSWGCAVKQTPRQALSILIRARAAPLPDKSSTSKTKLSKLNKGLYTKLQKGKSRKSLLQLMQAMICLYTAARKCLIWVENKQSCVRLCSVTPYKLINI